MTASTFPKLLSSQVGYDMARTMLDGFDKHYRLFQEASQAARQRFAAQDWHGMRQLQRDRIAFYDARVKEAVVILEDEYDAATLDDEIWQQVKLHYIGLLTSYLKPELAETFYNSVFTRMMHRSYYNNDFIFLHPAVATEYIENEEPASRPTYRAYYPNQDGFAKTFERIVNNCALTTPFEDLARDAGWVVRAFEDEFGPTTAAQNFQIHVLNSLFYRNKTAYVIGRIINDDNVIPMALAIRHSENGTLRIDTALFREQELAVVFSYTHAYFLVEMEIPSAFVHFLRTLMPRKPKAEIYTSLGLQKHGKNLFYRDYLHHLKHSSDDFIIAPGIKGMVMLVFTQASFPYVFKVIKDYFPPPKDTTRELIESKYKLVKEHDRGGRMADTLEFSNVAFPLARMDPALIRELQTYAPSQIEIIDQEVFIKHCYIERRMTPLNIWLQQGTDAQVEHGIIEYGKAVKELISANIFPGDMLFKNFGVTRHGRVVFYDYDEIEYLTDCVIRQVPQPRNEEEEMSGEIWYTVGPHDIFPETYRTFLLGDARVRKYFLQHHPDFFEPAMWQSYKDQLLAGQYSDVFPYAAQARFINRYS
ncbi:bifunctional isocitrate dehydrogenase kinase/phosphatase [Herminiimonas sp. CN]|uniref:bifunctional isocitrate dehydrogenase kinase/phosphatase n=1 Tax=Herminiimonas sp. CN TaxID=1349818 RepID=UPI00047398EA|nr:bifunctional isocitrate dehydrogenase kinase/phosphatase [Herminiimonas sp. CN]